MYSTCSGNVPRFTKHSPIGKENDRLLRNVPVMKESDGLHAKKFKYSYYSEEMKRHLTKVKV